MVKKVLVKDINNINFEKTVACIGYFDGVHLGHQKLIKQTINQANKLNVKSSVICFEPDPINVITNTKNPHILSYKNRLAIFEYLGIDIVYVIKFDKEFMNLKAEAFINKYLNKMNISKLICGFDYTFGFKAMGNPDLLIKNGKFETIVIEENKYAGKKISSTRIKEALFKGNYRLVNRLLGWDYFVDLKVEKCSKKASKWLIEAKLSDCNTILPVIDEFDETMKVKGNKVYITGNSKLEKNTHIFITFDE